ncbi:MAG TPA: M56 family peptidase, partial [Phaeodactylibacter sp.]|nr:M56 family peptidase [Phaeodactylibacter sp.]
MFTYLLKVTICWLGFYLIYAGFLKKETFFKTNRWYLLVTLILGAGIPLLEFLPIFQEVHPVVAYFQPLNDGVYYVQSSVSQAVTSSKFGWSELFLVGYILGVVITSIRFFVGLEKIYNLYRHGEISHKKNHILVLTNQPHLPFSFFKYLFWSKNLELNDADGEKIITHEEAHVKGWHSIDVILVEIFSIIFWCSPMVYFYKKSLKTVHEYLADAVVLQTMPTKNYGHLLLRQSQSGLQIALANHFFHSQLKQRIIMMTRSQSRKEAVIKYLFAIPVILLLVIAFSKKEAMANLDATPTATIQLDNTIEINEGLTTQKIEDFTPKEVDEMPRFPGCEEVTDKTERQKCSEKKMLQFIYTKIRYPKEAREAGVQGMVVIHFLVKKDGSIADATIKKEIGGGCGNAALKVIQEMPKWIPGVKDGKTVDVEFSIPVMFKLQGEDESEPIYNMVEEMPRFVGCEEMTDATERKKCTQKKMLTFIYTNIKYPKVARDLN